MIVGVHRQDTMIASMIVVVVAMAVMTDTVIVAEMITVAIEAIADVIVTMATHHEESIDTAEVAMTDTAVEEMTDAEVEEATRIAIATTVVVIVMVAAAVKPPRQLLPMVIQLLEQSVSHTEVDASMMRDTLVVNINDR